MAYNKQQLDLNRNFPAHWRGESEQQGAGPFPTSEPEVRACVAFLTEHVNICHAITFHTFSGVLLRPYSMIADEEFPVEDLEVYKMIGEKGQELTGYPALSVYHDFRYHAKEVITGTFDDWAYDHQGLLAWTVEILVTAPPGRPDRWLQRAGPEEQVPFHRLVRPPSDRRGDPDAPLVR